MVHDSDVFKIVIKDALNIFLNFFLNLFVLQIQVIEDDRKLRSSEFSTAQRGVVPPLVTTNFTVIDEGSSLSFFKKIF